MRLIIALAVGVIGFPYGFFGALAHDGEEHSNTNNNIVTPSILPEGQSEFPFKIGGEFKLVDQFGQIRTNVDAHNRPQLVFFGYANCESICSVAMPTIASAVDMLQKQNMETLPVMITIDPERDTKKIMKEKLQEIHPKFIGLTQEDEILKNVWKKFGINPTDQQLVDERERRHIFSWGLHIRCREKREGAINYASYRET